MWHLFAADTRSLQTHLMTCIHSKTLEHFKKKQNISFCCSANYIQTPTYTNTTLIYCMFLLYSFIQTLVCFFLDSTENKKKTAERRSCGCPGCQKNKIVGFYWLVYKTSANSNFSFEWSVYIQQHTVSRSQTSEAGCSEWMIHDYLASPPHFDNTFKN